MKLKKNLTRTAFLLIGAVTLTLISGPVVLKAGTGRPQQAQQKRAAPVQVSVRQKAMLAAFNKHVKDYVKQRDQVRKKLPKLSKDAKPEQIQAYQKSFVEALIARRAGAKPGYIFNPEIADYIRTL